ncbi:MAG: GTPase [Nitrososphaeria archaeon]
MPRKAIILGAAGRDFHNFNVFFRNNKHFKVIAFTATQIPYISNRKYPPKVSGRMYPKGIPIYDEEKMVELIKKHGVQDVYFSYSDVSHQHVMNLASKAMAAGASFHLLGPKDTELKSKKPVISIVATRTGAGKSTISRYVSSIIKSIGKKPVVVRHPMPYGDLNKIVQRFETYEDLAKYNITIEEREEYEQHIDTGTTVFAGVDYMKVLKEVEKEGDVIIWDGGNNDMPFYKPTINICVADPFRFEDTLSSFPGEVNFRSADVIVINKVNVSPMGNIGKLEKIAKREVPNALVVKTSSEAKLDKPELVKGKKVLVVEDGPTITHGGLSEAVGAFISKKLGATLVDPRDRSVGSIKEAFQRFPHIGSVMPALGYSSEQLEDLEKSISRVECDAVVLGTPSNISKVISINQPVARVWFEAKEVGEELLKERLINILQNI